MALGTVPVLSLAKQVNLDVVVTCRSRCTADLCTYDAPIKNKLVLSPLPPTFQRLYIKRRKIKRFFKQTSHGRSFDLERIVRNAKTARLFSVCQNARYLFSSSACLTSTNSVCYRRVAISCILKWNCTMTKTVLICRVSHKSHN